MFLPLIYFTLYIRLLFFVYNDYVSFNVYNDVFKKKRFLYYSYAHIKAAYRINTILKFLFIVWDILHC